MSEASVKTGSLEKNPMRHHSKKRKTKDDTSLMKKMKSIGSDKEDISPKASELKKKRRVRRGRGDY
jgi:hypothetical protein